MTVYDWTGRRHWTQSAVEGKQRGELECQLYIGRELDRRSNRATSQSSLLYSFTVATRRLIIVISLADGAAWAFVDLRG